MNKLKQFMNTITEKTNGAQGGSGDGASTPTFVDGEEQHSAEGFLCPVCMTAFSSPEVLAEHYQKEHERVVIDDDTSSLDPSMQSISGSDADREAQLQTALDEERTRVSELQRELIRLEDEVRVRAEQSTKFRHNDELTETEKLKKRLSTEIDQVGQLKLEKEILTRNISVYSSQFQQQSDKIKELELTITECKSMEESHAPQMEALTQEKEQLQRTLEEEKITNKNAFEELEATNKALTESLAGRTEDLDKHVAKNLVLEEESKKNNLALEAIKQELSESNRKAQMSDQTVIQLKGDLSLLREQHSELLGKLEAGEDGNQTALDALNKESKTLRENMQTLQVQFQEVSINYTNLQSELQKSETQSKTLSKANSALENSLKSVQEQLKEASQSSLDLKTELAKSVEDYKKLSDAKASLEKRRNTLEGQLKDLSASLAEFQIKYLNSQKECQKLNETVETTASSVLSLTEDLDRQKEELRKLRASEEASIQQKQQIVAEREVLEKELQEKLRKAEKDMESLKTEKEQGKAREDELSQLQMKSQNELEALKTKLEGVESNEKMLKEKLDKATDEISKREKQILVAEERSKGLEKSVEDIKEIHDALLLLVESEKTGYQTELTRLEKEKEGQKEEFLKKLDDLGVENQELKTQMEKLTVLSAEADGLRGDKIELEKKYKVSEEGKSLLLERCLQEEANSDKLGETIAELKRKLDDSQSALKELGRENQSLQVESAKLQGRKWADDSVVTSCSTCNKEFSLTIRKHHCRGCGNIFCNDCTARTASIPSSKKPVRVCDACYEELSTK